MRAYDLIRSRRSVHSFEPRPLPAALLERCLAAAVWAPNLGLTEPWRFIVAGPKARAVLAGRAADLVRGDPPRYCGDGAAVLRGCAEAVGVVQALRPDPATRDADRLAVAAAVQNILLCAWEEGIGGVWLGGPILADALARSVLGLTGDEGLVALLALGYPEAVPPVPPRRPATAWTRHVD